MVSRKVQITRTTRETDITMTLDMDAPGEPRVSTGLPFFDHLLASMSFHGRFFLDVRAKGDLDVDAHHLVEDVGIVLGQALSAALAKTPQVGRFAHVVIPMDEALAQVTIDVCGRPTLVWLVRLPQDRAGTFDLFLLREFFDGLTSQARMSLHVEARRGRNSHHMVEAAFKALGKALKEAYAPAEGGMSTKGQIG
jgi:imidazoleglycerol-phosphate dehydratase